jgi:hypothetical protein
MNLYRTFKTFLYWAIPSSYKSEDTSEFDTANDLVTIYKDLPDSGAYQNRKVSLNQLNELIGLPYKSYVAEFYFNGNNDPGEQLIYSEIYNNTGSEINWIVVSPGESIFALQSIEPNIFNAGLIYYGYASTDDNIALYDVLFTPIDDKNMYIYVKNNEQNVVVVGAENIPAKIEVRIYPKV